MYILHWPQAVPSTGELLLAVNTNEHKHYSEKTMFPIDDEGYYCSEKNLH